MIRFSKREDYAVILVDTLAQNFDKRFVPLSEVARRYRISLLFLRNIALDLRRAGLITAIEGKKGGYKLTKHPRDIRLGEVMKAFVKEQPLFSCCQNTTDGKCSISSCPHGFSLRRLSNEFMEKIANLSLAEFSLQK